MPRYYDDFPQYISAAERRRTAKRDAEKLASSSPVVIKGSQIAATFWGKSWCRNLEGYSDYSNRLPRGRSYVRNGCVVDLRIEAGIVNALVSGSELYDVDVTVTPIPKARWSSICKDCSGTIDSLVELLEGRFPQTTMQRLCQQRTGLFPTPAELEFNCSCPDSARMCKHIAAVLYGIGARLDHQPELLFTLREVDQQDLISQVGKHIARPKTSKILAEGDLSELFEIDIAKPPRRKRSR